MEDHATPLLKRACRQEKTNHDRLILLHIGSPNSDKHGEYFARNWQALLPQISCYDTTVFEFDRDLLQRESLVQLLRRGNNFLPELFEVHLKNEGLSTPIIFLCEGLGGLLLKEAIADAGDENQLDWQTRLNCICLIVFMGTPHLDRIRSTPVTDLLDLGLGNTTSGQKMNPLSQEQLQEYKLSAMKFVNTLKKIDAEPRILSGYQLAAKKQFLKNPLSKKSLIIDHKQASIGIPDLETLVPMEAQPRKILDPAHDSSFRDCIAQNIQAAMERYRRFSTNSISSNNSIPQILTPISSGRASLSSPRPDFRPELVPWSSSHSSIVNREITAPFVYPRNFLKRYSDYFQPRNDVLSVVEDILVPSNESGASRSQPLALFLTGLGGVGKTEVARDFAMNVKSHRFDVVLFVIANSRSDLLRQFTEIASSLSICQSNMISDPDMAKERLKAWFQHPSKNLSEFEKFWNSPLGMGGMESPPNLGPKLSWLLILDNVDSASTLRDFWPWYGKGSILVTSRDPSIGFKFFSEPSNIDLGGLNERGAIELLKKLSRCTDDTSQQNDDAASTVVQRLEHLPLAITQIGPIIARKHLSLTQFANDYVRASQFHKLYDESLDDNYRRGYEHNLGSVWAFDNLQNSDPSALLLLYVLAMLDPACMQEEMIVKGLAVINIAADGYPKTKDDFRDTMSRLIDRSLVWKHSDGASFHMHRLVQDVARARLVNEKDLESGNRSLACFNIAWSTIAESWHFRSEEVNTAGSVSRWEKCATFYPHIVHLSHVVEELRDVYPDMEIPLEFLDLLYEAAWWQIERRDATESTPLTDLGASICDILSPPEKMNSNELRNPLQFRQTKFWACKILIALMIGDGKKANTYSGMRLMCAENEVKIKGQPSSFLTSCLDTYAMSLSTNGLYEDAIPYLERSIELRKQLPNFRDDWLYTPTYHLGLVHYHLGKLEDAAHYLLSAIRDREARFGTNDRESTRTGALYYTLGNIRKSQGATDEAYSLHHRAHLQCRLTAGDSTLPALRCRQKLAEDCESLGLYPEATAYLQGVLRFCGERDDRKREAAQASFIISRILQRNAEYEQSQKYREMAVGLYNSLRPRSQRVVETLSWTDINQLVPYDFF